MDSLSSGVVGRWSTSAPVLQAQQLEAISSTIGIVASSPEVEHTQLLAGLNDEKCKELLETILLRRELKQKADQIANLKSQIEELAADRDRTTAEATNEGQGRGDFSTVSNILETDNDDSLISVHCNHHGGVLHSTPISDSCIEVPSNVSIQNIMELDLNDPSVQQSLTRWFGLEGPNWEREPTDCFTVAKELIMGSGAGYVSGYLVNRYGKNVLCSLAGGALLIRFAHSKGYINVDWRKLSSDIEDPVEGDGDQYLGRARVATFATRKVRTLREWAKDNSYLAVGFACGFILKTFTSI